MCIYVNKKGFLQENNKNIIISKNDNNNTNL